MLENAGRVLLAWLVMLFIEHAIMGIVWRDEIAGAWELWPARTAAAPIFIGVGVVAAVLCSLASRLAARSDRRPIHALGTLVGVAVGWGVGTGRHFEAAVVGVPIYRVVLALAVGGLALGGEYAYFALKRCAATKLPVVLLVVAVSAWWVDGHVLVRLYPAFHAGLFVLSLALLGFAAIDAKVPEGANVALATLALGALCALYAPFAAKRLRGYDNLRRVLVEHAPWLGRAARVATAIAPPEAVMAVDVKGPGEVARALDWNGRDVVLVSIDALRADHVGAYGYQRATTPHIDALAREGTLFRHAYCPTPHTSYSVTSMMTGKYVRPLLALGLGGDSETLASHLRRYGYRTAAFYPPAVFFIDESKFTSFEERALDFEYRKVEFADPSLREAQVREYLASAPSDRPLFLWVHFFEPHEPYVQHPEWHFGDTDLDAYDSEIATADDGVGRIVSAVRAVRPSAVVIVTADHGEEFGEHGGRYHGTTVYEEQVRVPLVIVGGGVRKGATVDVPVQTIDLVPTVLSALGIPRPARVRGRDLGGLLAQGPSAVEQGFAFAETDDFSLLAKRSLRLVCQKQADACTLFDVTSDSSEKHDLSPGQHADVDAMRSELYAVERSHGRFEGQGAALPEALRRGAAGDIAAAEEVSGLLDDVNATYRREAARVLFDLRSPKVSAQLARARSRDDDEEVRGMCEAALVRIDKSAATTAAKALLASSSNVEVRRRLALALAEREDPVGASELVAWLTAPSVDFTRQREIVQALAQVKARSAVPTLVTLLDDVRLRGLVATALGAIGDRSAKSALLAHFESEPYVVVRPLEANALLALGAGKEMLAPLTRFAGLPEPMAGALEMARSAGVLTGAPPQAHELHATLRAQVGLLRLGVLLDRPGSAKVEVNGALTEVQGDGRELWADVASQDDVMTVHAQADGGILGVWLVPKSSDFGGDAGPAKGF